MKCIKCWVTFLALFTLFAIASPSYATFAQQSGVLYIDGAQVDLQQEQIGLWFRLPTDNQAQVEARKIQAIINGDNVSIQEGPILSPPIHLWLMLDLDPKTPQTPQRLRIIQRWLNELKDFQDIQISLVPFRHQGIVSATVSDPETLKPYLEPPEWANLWQVVDPKIKQRCLYSSLDQIIQQTFFSQNLDAKRDIILVVMEGGQGIQDAQCIPSLSRTLLSFYLQNPRHPLLLYIITLPPSPQPEEVLENLAQNTGGQYFDHVPEADLPKQLNSLTQKWKQQWWMRLKLPPRYQWMGDSDIKVEIAYHPAVDAVPIVGQRTVKLPPYLQIIEPRPASRRAVVLPTTLQVGVYGFWLSDLKLQAYYKGEVISEVALYHDKIQSSYALKLTPRPNLYGDVEIVVKLTDIFGREWAKTEPFVLTILPGPVNTPTFMSSWPTSTPQYPMAILPTKVPSPTAVVSQPTPSSPFIPTPSVRLTAPPPPSAEDKAMPLWCWGGVILLFLIMVGLFLRRYPIWWEQLKSSSWTQQFLLYTDRHGPPRPLARLVVESSHDPYLQGGTFYMDQTHITIGQHIDNDLPLPAETDVNLYHGTIEYHEDGFYFQLNSPQAQAWINGRPVRQSVRLRHGDRIQLGTRTVLQFLLTSGGETAQSSRARSKIL